MRLIWLAERPHDLKLTVPRAIRKPSPHTAKAYRQDFAAIATLFAGAPGTRRALDAGRDY